jgi:hypothetical protein
MKTMPAVVTMNRELEPTEQAWIEGGARLDPDSYERNRAAADAHARLVGGGFFSNEMFGTPDVWRWGSLLSFNGK